MKKIINLEKLFKGLLICLFVMLLMITINGIFYSEIELPSELCEDALRLFIIESILLLLVLIYIIDFFLLYKFYKIGKILFVPLNLLLIIFTSEFSLVCLPVNRLEYILNELSLIVTGTIITLIYWTDLKEKFVSSSKKKDELLS